MSAQCGSETDVNFFEHASCAPAQRFDLHVREHVEVRVAAVDGRDEVRARCQWWHHAEGVAQRGWLAARLADRSQLAPHLGLAVERGVRLLLVAPRFDDRTRAAAEALGPAWLTLAERLPRGDLECELRLLEQTPAASPLRAAVAPVRAGSGFRSGLRD